LRRSSPEGELADQQPDCSQDRVPGSLTFTPGSGI
jgi:hypothetical protein